jgi:hypothetical protein
MSSVSTDIRIAAFIAELAQMRRGGTLDDPKPHKLLMILSVLDLLDSGVIHQNCIPFDDQLVRRFTSNFREFAGPDDYCQAGPPFFHLRNSSFWRHRIREGREEPYARIKRVGGSTQLITDNIEYAFLCEDLFAVLLEPAVRAGIREKVSQMLDLESGSRKKETGRLGLAFHESFPLSLPALTALLKISANNPCIGDVGLARETIRQQTNLGPNYIRSMPRWAVGSGLFRHDYHLTDFGLLVREKDPTLTRVETLWVMHYNLSAPSGPGPEFWHYLVSTLLRPGDIIETKQTASAIQSFLQKGKGEAVAPKTLSKTATIFLGTYNRSDALGQLGIAEQLEAGRYLIKQPITPSLWVFAYVLSVHWRANWEDVVGVNIGHLSEASGPGALLLMGSGSINRYLGDLQSEGFVVVQRRTPPFQANRTWSSPTQFLERLYD